MAVVVEEFPDDFEFGNERSIQVKGRCNHHAKDFSINLCEGPQIEPNTHLMFNPRFNEELVYRTNMEDGNWNEDDMDSDGGFPFKQGKKFVVDIFYSGQNTVNIDVNREWFCEYQLRMPKDYIRYVVIDGDVDIKSIKFYRDEPRSDSEGSD